MKRPTMLRPFAALALTAAVGFGSSACSSVERDAARIEGSSLTISELESLVNRSSETKAADTKKALDALKAAGYGQANADEAKVTEAIGAASNALQALVSGLGQPQTQAQTEATDGFEAAIGALQQAAGDVAPQFAAANTAIDNLVTSFAGTSKVRTAAEIRSAITQWLVDQAPADRDAAFWAAAKVWVNPAYGAFDPTQGIVALSDVAAPAAAQG